MQDFINDSRLKIINVSQDSRLNVQDTSPVQEQFIQDLRSDLPDLTSPVQEQFIQDLRSDNLTELTVSSVIIRVFRPGGVRVLSIRLAYWI